MNIPTSVIFMAQNQSIATVTFSVTVSIQQGSIASTWYRLQQQFE
jgi:hypothetical protein